MATGIGGDVVAIIAHGDDVDGLDAAGAAPAGADPESPIQASGACSVTVPGAVPGWAALADRYGRLGLDRCLSDAIDVARRGFAVMPRCAHTWAHRGANCPPELQPCPTAGEIRRASELADTLEAIAGEGSSAFYTGQVAAAIASVSWLTEADLAACRARWVAPLRHRYRDHEVIEPPPPTQGIAALEALALLDGLKPTLANQIRCTRLALQDALARVHDGAEVQDLLAPAYLHRRRAELSEPVTEPAGGTVYLCAVDQGRMAVSLTQSLYAPFGSGVIAPGTGVLLQNRAACFGVHGRITPGRRPYHTTIPAMLRRDGALRGAFGIVGGFIQAQAHLQVVSAVVDDHLDPQVALDRSRFRIDGDLLRIEEGLDFDDAELATLMPRISIEHDTFEFGGGQMILLEGDALIGGSDRRKDGHASGISQNT